MVICDIVISFKVQLLDDKPIFLQILSEGFETNQPGGLSSFTPTLHRSSF